MSSTNKSKSTQITTMSKQSAYRKVSPYNGRKRIEDTLLRSFISEKEILITYYEDGYFPSNRMTVIEINPLKRYVICIDILDRKHTFNFIDIIDAH